MNKFLYFVLLFVTLFSCIQQTEARPLRLVSAATKTLLSILGQATYYDVESGLGSCGTQSSHDEPVVAVNYIQMKNGANPNKNPLCQKKVKINGPKGKQVMARIVDTCPGCNKGCLDMSMSLFQQVCGDLSLGVCKINWDFV